MRKIFGLVLAGVAGLAMTAPAVAQDMTRYSTQRSSNNGNSSEIESYQNDLKAAEARANLLADPLALRNNWDTARRLASCAVSLNPDRAETFLKQDMPSLGVPLLEMNKYLDRVRGCAPTNIRLDPAFVRGALAEDILVDPKTAPEIPGPGDSKKLMDFIGAVAISGDRTGTFGKAQMAAECRTAISPIGARGVLATEPGSQAEVGAFAALDSVTTTCDQLDPSEEMPTYFRRAFLAQSLYHWTNFAD